MSDLHNRDYKMAATVTVRPYSTVFSSKLSAQVISDRQGHQQMILSLNDISDLQLFPATFAKLLFVVVVTNLECDFSVSGYSDFSTADYPAGALTYWLQPGCVYRRLASTESETSYLVDVPFSVGRDVDVSSITDLRFLVFTISKYASLTYEGNNPYTTTDLSPIPTPFSISSAPMFTIGHANSSSYKPALQIASVESLTGGTKILVSFVNDETFNLPQTASSVQVPYPVSMLFHISYRNFSGDVKAHVPSDLIDNANQVLTFSIQGSTVPLAGAEDIPQSAYLKTVVAVSCSAAGSPINFPAGTPFLEFVVRSPAPLTSTNIQWQNEASP